MKRQLPVRSALPFRPSVTHGRGRTVTHSAAASAPQWAASAQVEARPRPRSSAVPVRRAARQRPPLRIGYVSDRFPCANQGFVLQEVLGLRALGIDVEVFSLGVPNGRIDETAMALGRLDRPVRYFPGDPGFSEAAGCPWEPDAAEQPEARGDSASAGIRSRQALWLAAEVVARRITHLHAHSATVPTEIAREAGRLTGIGYSFTAYANGLYDGADVPLLRKKIEDGRFVVTLTDFNRGRLLRICGAEVADKLHRIPMGIDAAAHRFCHPELHDGNSVLAVGPLVLKSGFSDLVDAIAILRNRGRDTRLTIVGQGEFEHALRAQIQRCGLTDRVVLLTETRADLIMLMKMHTAMVLPWAADDADRDILASVILDAMATGIVVLSTDFAAIRELIHDGVTGRLIDSCDPPWLAAALEGLFDSPKQRELMAVRARTTVELRFSASRNVSRLARLFVKSASGDRSE
jgi:glycosyltransferase involved in cell wall biosynthesis